MKQWNFKYLKNDLTDMISISKIMLILNPLYLDIDDEDVINEQHNGNNPSVVWLTGVVHIWFLG